MSTFPLHLRDGHLFVEVAGALWLLDTGAPTSFGTPTHLSLGGEEFRLESGSLGLTAATLSRFVRVRCAGLLGADILGRFDHLLDPGGATLTLSTSELAHTGQTVPLDQCRGIPIVTAQIRGANCRMFFDTSAQFSYFQDDSLRDFPFAGSVTDFYPGVGEFQTETHSVPLTLSGIAFTLRCGRLPELLQATLRMAGTVGIVGNEILANRTVGYFPRRRLLVL